MTIDQDWRLGGQAVGDRKYLWSSLYRIDIFPLDGAPS